MFSRGLVVLAMALATLSTVTALPVAGEEAATQQLCVLRRGDDAANSGEATAEVAC